MNNEKLKELEIQLKRLQRKVPRQVSVSSVPFPVSIFCKVPIDAVAARYMFPAAGTISRACFYVEDSSGPVNFEAKILHRNGDMAVHHFVVPMHGLIEELEIPVGVGDRIEISAAEGITDIWVAMLWKPHIKDHVLKSFAVEELVNAVEDQQ